MIRILLHLFVHGLLHLFFILPGLLLAYLVTDLLKIHLGSPFGTGYWVKVFGVAYCWIVLLFFLKGMIRRQGTYGLSYRILRIIWYLFCFGWPTILFKVFVADMLGIHSGGMIPTGDIGCWIAAVLIGRLAFSRYRLKKDTAPFIVHWVYRLACGPRS